jgi:LacI family transcriptional regulator
MAKPSTDSVVTIHDVARHCGLSSTTVSRALNGKHLQYRISPVARQRVLDAAVHLGFRANWKAKTLGDRRSFQVGMLFRHTFPEFRAIFESVLSELTVVLEQAGYHLLFLPVHNDKALNMIKEHRLDGLVIGDPLGDEIYNVIDQVGAPSVVLNNVSANPEHYQVIPDDEQGMSLALDHLIGLGHRKIAYFRMGRGSVARHYSVAVRREAYLSQMHERGLSDTAIAVDEPTDEFLSRVRVGQDVTAIICYSHTEVVNMTRALAIRGIRVPQDVSLIGFNNVFPTEVLFPATTVIDVPGASIGRTGGRLLLEQLSSDVSSADLGPRRVTLAESLIVRESTSSPAA